MAARRRDADLLTPTRARSDVYTGLLVISLLAMIAACAFLFLDYSTYQGKTPAKAPNFPVPQVGGGTAPAPAPGGPITPTPPAPSPDPGTTPAPGPGPAPVPAPAPGPAPVPAPPPPNPNP